MASGVGIAMEDDVLQVELKSKQICRFCLSQHLDKLGNLYSRDPRLKCSASLPMQVMACASIEIFPNDGMPQYICNDCRLLFDHSYRFKQMCKRAETLLRQYPLTKKWPNALSRPAFPIDLLSDDKKLPISEVASSATPDASIVVSPSGSKTKVSIELLPKKILNSDPADSPEPPAPTRIKKEKLSNEATFILTKVENNEELSLDDVQRLVAATDDEAEYVHEYKPPPAKKRPRVLNKSAIRILNKNAEASPEPRMSTPQVKRDVDGKVAVVTEILDPNETYDGEMDPAKNVVPLETVVYPCPQCERSFPLRQLRDIHMVNHTRSRRFHCSVCDKSFFSKYDLQKHNLVHTGDRPFKCTICEKAFTRATLLHRHEKTHTDVPKFICIYCEKPFISKEEMEKHSERHLKNRPYQCSVCKKAFAFKQGLERHEVVHSRDQPFPCQYCDQSFSTPSKLQRHLTAHAGSRPYPCKFCHKAYLLSHHLTRHLRSHKNGIGSFTCSDCQKVFRTRDELIYHSAVHATQTLICPLCKEIFSNVQSVTNHIKQHAEGEAYACEFCDLIFMTADCLQKHSLTEHAGDMDAYQQDEQSRTKDEGGGKSQANSNENLSSLEETIEEFLIDEFLEEDEVSREQHSAMAHNDNNFESFSTEAKVISEIVLRSDLDEVNEDIFLFDGEREYENTAKEDAKEVVAPSSAKMRKVESSRSKEITKVAMEPPSKRQTAHAQSRRKAPTTQSASRYSEKVDGERDNTQAGAGGTRSSPKTINSVLKMIPRDVSVRRNSPLKAPTTTAAAAATTTTATSLNSSSSKQLKTMAESSSSATQQGRTTRHSSAAATSGASKRSPVKSDLKRSTSLPMQNKKEPPPGLDKKSSQSKVNTKSSPATGKQHAQDNAGANAITKQSPEGKTMTMMLGNKNVKVQKIVITKAEAAAMAKDGRLCVKGGAMVLRKAAK